LDDALSTDRDHVVTHMLAGLIAAFLVPLFLSVISSDLMFRIGTNWSQVLVLFGFCLVASMSSYRFIDAISGQVLATVRRATEEAKTGTAEIDKKLTRLAEQVELLSKQIPKEDHSRPG